MFLPELFDGLFHCAQLISEGGQRLVQLRSELILLVSKRLLLLHDRLCKFFDCGIAHVGSEHTS